MHRVEPRVFLVGETATVEEGIQDYLNHIGAPNWTTDAETEAEGLVEFMGRVCYRSFAPDLNPNVKKIRTIHAEYIENIHRVKHGSVTEHSTVSFIFTNVSRVFTHELVRHRVGVAISQESLRYVRLEDLGLWLPPEIEVDPAMRTLFEATFESLEELQLAMAEHFNLDDPDVEFKDKKKITSAMRRIAPIGLATSIGWTANFRSLRWLLELRTHPAAEAEIRHVFEKVGILLTYRYPNMFGDFTAVPVEGYLQFTTPNSKA